MVSERCKTVVKLELKKLGLHFVFADMGVVDVMEDLTTDQLGQIRIGLHISGLELMDDKKAVLIEKIKKVIVEMVYTESDSLKINFSDYLAKKLNLEYSYMAGIFSEVQGITLEKYLISYKIEKVKEMLIYDQLSLSEIAWKMNYSSVAHLSNQFKKTTGLTTSYFKSLSFKRQNSIDKE